MEATVSNKSVITDNHLRTDGSLSHRWGSGGLKYILSVTNLSPKFCMFLKHNNCLARMGASFLLQCIIIEKPSNQINIP